VVSPNSITWSGDGCPHELDQGSGPDPGTGRSRGVLGGDDGRCDPSTGASTAAAVARRRDALLLRDRSHGLCAAAPAAGPGGDLHGDRALAHAGQAGDADQDGSSRRTPAGGVLPQWGVDRGASAQRDGRGAARSMPVPRRRASRFAAGTPATVEVPVAATLHPSADEAPL